MAHYTFIRTGCQPEQIFGDEARYVDVAVRSGRRLDVQSLQDLTLFLEC
jgi:hypothetical protein